MSMYQNQEPIPPSGPPQAAALTAPRPLKEAIQELPSQYLKVISRPSPATFAEELGKESWSIVWVQVIIWAVIIGILEYFARLIYPLPAGTGGVSSSTIQAVTAGSFIGPLIGVPLGFFIWMGIVYLVAKLFHGQATYLRQSYASLLFQVPLGIISGILSLIPFVGIISFAVFIYGIILQIYAVMAAHRLSGGQATGVVLLPAAILTVLACSLGLAFIGFILALFGMR